MRPKVKPKAPSSRAPARLGVRVEPAQDGLRVRDVAPGSLGQRVGLRPGDLLTRVNGQTVHRPDDVAKALAASPRKTSVLAKRGATTHRGSVEHLGG